MWQIAAATGWSVRYILWGVNYQTLRMMLADAPRYVEDKKTTDNGKKKTVTEFFQSRLKKE